MPDYEFIDHTADLAVKVQGKDLPTLFTNAAKAMIEYLSPTSASSQVSAEEEIVLSAFDQNALLVAWLSEILYRTEIEKKVYTEFEIKELTEKSLRVAISGYQAQKFAKDIKAVTHHNLAIEKTGEGYEVTITFDI